ncbi:MAG TPA: SDR family oxidoreductase [Gemmataceae bacterium]|nr:SDR family oxidoreductase [Gemmataceae bacterium]
MTADLAGKVALVTGGGRGLGEAICLALAEAGASVAVADLRPDLAESVAGRLRAGGTRGLPLGLDVGDDGQAGEAVRRVVGELGRLDVLVNNAGTDVTLSVEELSFGDFDRVVRTNLRGPFVLSKHAFPVMRGQGGGQIVNIVSTAAKRAWANATAYHASKWGLLGLSHALHVEGRKHNIRVTAVVSGGMRTPFILDRFPDTPLDVLQDPRNVARTVRFVLTLPPESVIAEVMVLPMRETSWP